MTELLKPYAGYQPSGADLIGSFPSHWQVLRAKVLLREVDERSQTGNEELLSVSHKTGVTPRREKNVTMFLAESNVGAKLCRPGDVVVNTMWAWMAAVGISKDYGLVSPSYAVYRRRRPGLFSDKYLDELLRTPKYRAEYLARSTGITSSRLRLYPDEFLTIPIPVPPLDEQAAIARFLVDVDRRIRRYVHAAQQLVNLLKERRLTITHQAQLSSGTHAYRIGVVAGQTERPINREDDEVYVPIGLYNRGRGIFHKLPTKGAELGDSRFFWIEEGDLVLSGQFAWEGSVALADGNDHGCVASHRYPILRGKADIAESAYLLSFLQTGWGQMLLNHHSRGAAGRNRPLNIRSLMKEKIPLPALAVQSRIANLVRLESLIKKKMTDQTKHLQEYRTRMVTDVVTGQVDVREAASRLTEEIEEANALPLTDELLEGGDDADLLSDELAEEEITA